MQCFVYVHIHRFYSQALEAVTPALCQEPVVVHRGKAVLCANHLAQRQGVAVGLALAEAKALVPGAQLVPWSSDTYADAQERWLQRCSEVADRIETKGQHAALLDLSGHTAPAELTRRLAQTLTADLHYAVSVGLASTTWTAEVSAKELEGLSIADELRLTRWLDDPISCLAPLPVANLMPVVPANRQRLTFLGYRTIGDVAEIPLETLRDHFGGEGLRIYQAARGGAGDPFQPNYPPDSLQERWSFDAPITERAVLDHGLQVLAARISRRLQEADVAGQDVRLWVEGEEAKREGQRSFIKPIYSTRTVLVALTALIEPLLPELDGVQRLRVQICNLKKNKRQQTRFTGLTPEREQGLDGAMAELQIALGSGAIQKAADVSLSRRRELMREWKRATGWR